MHKRKLTYIALLVAFLMSFIFFLVDPITSNHILSYIFVMVGLVGLWISGLLVERHKESYPWGLALPTMILKYSLWALGLFAVNVLAEQALDFHIGLIWLFFAYMLLLVFYAVRIIMLSGGIHYIDKQNIDTQAKVSIIKHMTVEVGLLAREAESTKIKAGLQSIQEKLKYSDPMSHDSLQPLEKEMEGSIVLIQEAMLAKTDEKVLDLLKTLESRIIERNKRCLLLKK